MSRDFIAIQTADFDPALELSALTQAEPDAKNENADAGAVASFIGLVRGEAGNNPPVRMLTLEHYPGMTEQALAAIVAEARCRWDLLRVRVIHRVGPLPVRARIVFVGVASLHRADAFAACAFIMDTLKTQAPFWKKETTPDGTRWVAARASDEAAAARWQEDTGV